MSFVLTNCISDPLSFCFKTFKSGQESSPFSSPDGSVSGAPIMPTPPPPLTPPWVDTFPGDNNNFHSVGDSIWWTLVGRLLVSGDYVQHCSLQEYLKCGKFFSSTSSVFFIS